MHQSKLIETLRVLSKRQLERLREFIVSPFFNKNERLVLFCDYLLQYAPIFDAPELAREQVYAFLFPNEAYDDLRIRHAMSDLLKLVERFIEQIQQEGKPVPAKLALATFYNDHALLRHLKDTLQGINRLQKQNPKKNEEFFLNQLLIEREYAFLLSLDNKRTIDYNLKARVQSLNVFFIVKQLKLACFIANTSNNFATEFEHPLLKEVLQLLQHSEYIEIPVISIYYNGYKMLTEEDSETYFWEFCRLMREHFSLFEHVDEKMLYTLAKNYCVWKINAGEEVYYQHLFELFQEEISHYVATKREVDITQGNFKNMVTVGLRLGMFDWVEKFIKSYSGSIAATYPQDVMHYNLAQLYFYKKNYDDAIELLGKKYDDPFYEIDSRKLLIKIYYETDELFVLHNTIKTLRVFIHRNKHISRNHKTTNRNFINFLSKIIKLKQKKKFDQVVNLQETIQNEELVAERKWLLEKLQELN